ncbi:MAG TPA: GNAT family N-acetyltransferase [Rhodocyclaceae bacterium]|nr:GNAT family N-acetyltransferase [Rhodocyclaceae bacterium]
MQFLDSIADLPTSVRRMQVGDDPFLLPGFLEALEHHGVAGPDMAWQARHLLLSDELGNGVGWMPLYLRGHSFGDFLRDWSWSGAWERLGHDYYPKLVTGIPYTPVTGPRLLTDDAALRPALVDAALQAVEAFGASSWHVAFPTADEAALLESRGLLLQPQVQFQWFNRGYRDFDDYLATFASDKRRKVRAERRKVAEAGVEIQVLGGHQVPPELWPRLHQLYANTFRRYGNYPAITAACYADMAAAMGDRMQVFIARRLEDVVAVAICYRSGTTLYGRYWGSDEDIPGLHFDLCYYQGIDYCIRHGLDRFEPGAGGEHKLARGFEPTRVVTAHWIAQAQMREVLRRHLTQLDAAIEDYRQEAASHLPFRVER